MYDFGKVQAIMDWELGAELTDNICAAVDYFLTHADDKDIGGEDIKLTMRAFDYFIQNARRHDGG